MYFAGGAKDLLYKCTILTAMMRRLTRVLFGQTFRKLTFKVNKLNHKSGYVKRGMYRMRRLILIFTIHTYYKCHFSCDMCSPIRSRPYGSLCRFLHDSKIVCVNRGDCPQNPNVFYFNIQYDQFVSVVALSALLTKLNGALCLHPPRTLYRKESCDSSERMRRLI